MKILTNRLSVCVLAALLLSTGSAMAQSDNIQQQTSEQYNDALLGLTLSKAVEIALAENPTIRVADKDIALKEVADKEAWQALLPSASLDLALSHSIKVAEIRTSMGSFKMGMDGSTTAQGGINVALPLYAPAAYQNMKLTKEDILLAKEKANASRQDLVNQVTKAYYSALLAQDSYEVMLAAYNTAKSNYENVEQKFNVGKVSEYDKMSAEVQMRTMSSTVTSTETGVKLALLQLKVLMGVTADVTIKLNDSLRAYESQLVLPAEESEDAVENNSDLRQLDMNAGLLARTGKILKTNFLPTVGAQFTAQYQSMSNPNWNIFNYHYSPSLSLAFAVSVPLFKASNFTKLKSNKIQLEQLQDRRVNVKRQLSLAARNYRENMITTVAKLESDRQAVAQANKVVTISTKRYDVGHGTILELNQSQTALTQAELTLDQSIYNYLVNKADLDYTLGRNY